MPASAESLTDEPTVDDPTIRQPQQRLRLLGQVVLAYGLLVSLVPLNPSMPEQGLDASWKVAINRATAQGLQFGHDIVFTYGPYGGVLTGVYEPGIRLLTLGAAVTLAAGYVIAALLALRTAPAWVHVAAGTVVVVLTPSGSQGLDTLALLYPVLVVCAIPRLPDQRVLRILAAALMATPFGLLPLAKLSVVPAIGAGVIAAGLLSLRRRDWVVLAVLGVTPVLSLVFWWLVAHQSMTGIIDYVRGSWYLISGYSEAMAVHETSRFAGGVVTVTFLITAAMVFGVGLIGWRHVDWLIQLSMVAVTLFLVFKAGFVRADSHMQAGALGLLVTGVLVAVSLPLHRPPRRRAVIALATAYAVAGAAVCYISGPLGDPVKDLRSRTSGLVVAIGRGDVSPDALRRRYDAAMTSIRRAAALPPAKGRTDLYTSSLNLLFAHGATWDPRPVIQSYSAYTPELAELNARHLAGRDAPRTLYFQIGPIDNRLAGLEDGASWLPLLEHYDVMRESSPAFLFLRHRSVPRPVQVEETTHVLRARIGARLEVPPTSGSKWLASFDVRPTVAGKLRSALWKPPQLAIEIRTADGKTDVRRFIPSMASSDFILSPYVSDTASLGSLFPGQPPPPPGREVTSIRLLVESSAALHFWNAQYSVRLRTLNVMP